MNDLERRWEAEAREDDRRLLLKISNQVHELKEQVTTAFDKEKYREEVLKSVLDKIVIDTPVIKAKLLIVEQPFMAFAGHEVHATFSVSGKEYPFKVELNSRDLHASKQDAIRLLLERISRKMVDVLFDTLLEDENAGEIARIMKAPR